MRFRRCGLRQRLVWNICDRIIHHMYEVDERAVVVAYDNASFVTSGRFLDPVPGNRPLVGRVVAIRVNHGPLVNLEHVMYNPIADVLGQPLL